MPYMTTITVQVDDLNRGDLLHMRSGSIAPVVKVDRKRTRATVTVDDCGVFTDHSMHLNELVTVDRERLTDEELEQQRIDNGVRRIQSIKDEALKQTPAEFLTAAIAKNPDRPLDNWNTGEYMELLAQYELWKRIEYIGNNYAENGVTYRDCLMAAFADIVLDRPYPRDPLSRSTSVIRNLFEDVERYVVDRARDRVLSYSALTISDLTSAQGRVRLAIEVFQAGGAA